MTTLSDYTALYTPEDSAYANAMSGVYEDLSWQDDGAVCIAAKKEGQITGAWRPAVAFGDPRTVKLWIESLWCESRDIVFEDYLVDGVLSEASRFLLRHGYTATPHYVQVIDLTVPEEELRHNLRRSYRSLVNAGDGVVPCSVGDMHAVHKAVGGVTRPDCTWDIQAAMQTVCYQDMIQNCAVMFYQGPTWAYYASAAGDNTHACIWSALLELKDRGVQFCEMGTQDFAGDPKAVAISFFKRGFGGKTITRLILRKPK